MAVERQHVKEQDKNERRHNFNPVESNLTEEQVKLEASRCLHCKNPRCISSVEQDLDQVFKLTDRENRVYRCAYCESKKSEY